ncbi:MAG: MFS transporter [Candidatus Omnitrophica bacterium]|nr:MFS transporter [Candidatus Omnitrophota bacterium]
MEQSQHHKTASKDRIPLFQKVIYGIGSFVNQFAGAATNQLIIVLNLGLGMNPALVGWIGAVPRFLDAFSDPLIGYSSDNTRTRWGRRKPWILFGAIFSGALLALMFQLYKGHGEYFYFWWVLAIQCLFVLTFACYSIPWIALGYEMTPDYHERTRLQAYASFFAQPVWMLAPWIFKIISSKDIVLDFTFKIWKFTVPLNTGINLHTGFTDIVHGARVVAIVVGIFITVGGILPAIFSKELYGNLPKAEKGKGSVLLAFLNGPKLTAKDFGWAAVICALLSLINFGIHVFTWKAFDKIVLINYALALFLVLLLSALLIVAFFKKLGNVPVVKDILNNCVTSFQCGPFVKLIAVTFLIFNGFMLASAFTAYVVFFYCFGKQPTMDLMYQNGGTLLGCFGTLSAICTAFFAIPLTTWISTKLGKRKTFLITMSLAIFGYVLKWIGYNPQYPYLLLIAAPFLAFHLGSLFTLVCSMVADVCDLDELQTGTRREGMFSGIYWWIQKLGIAGASVLSGYLLNWTGFKQELGLHQATHTLFYMRVCDVGIPIVTSVAAIFIIMTFKLSEDNAYDIRRQLEERRGKT